ncbi:MAG: HAMP domain-containing histidine kinase [Blautia sp.]|nr:HAMP domain-containing histidine kinase [Blautia sp.]MCM1199660.1 HAMP domain-containing histidine kinase [Bacteroides fragilis]
MESALWALILFLTGSILILLAKIHLMRKAAGEIREGIGWILTSKTNTLLTISSHDGEMKKLAAALNEELRGLRRKRHRYEQGDLRLKEAVANLSHDIRTPLTALCGYLELTKQQLAQPSAQENMETVRRYVGIMEERTEALKQLTEELFRYALTASDVQEIPLEEVVLNHMLEESVSSCYAVLKDRKITPVIDMPEEQVKCRLNKNILSRILGNIIENAIKYSGGDLRIMLSGNGEMVFSNHAAGMDEVQAGKLFDRFYTVHTGRRSTGLGLSIARQLTERMGGTVDAVYRDGMLSIHLFFPME